MMTYKNMETLNEVFIEIRKKAYIALYACINLIFFWSLISRRHDLGRWSITHFPDKFWIHYHISRVTIWQFIHHPHYTNRRLHEDYYKLLDFESNMC